MKIEPPLGPADGPARACRSACKIFGIIGQRLQIVARMTSALALFAGVGSDAGPGVFLHGHLLRGGGHLQLKVQRLQAAFQCDFGRLRHCQIRGRSQHSVVPRHQPANEYDPSLPVVRA